MSEPPPGWGQPPPPPPPPPPPAPPGWGQPPPPPGWGQGQWPAQAPAPLPKAGSARTGPLPLHPMTVSDVLDGAFKLFKANARTVLLISAALYIPIEFALGFLQRHYLGGSQGLFNFSTTSSSTLDPSTATIVAIVFGGLAVRYLALQLVTGAVSHVVAESYLGGELTPAGALRASVHKWPALVAAYLLVHLCEAVGFVACVLPALIVMSLFFRTVPVIVVEDIGPIAGMRRSWRLGQSRLWPTIGIALLAWLVSTMIGVAVSLVPTIAGSVIGTAHGGWVLVAAGRVLSQMVAQPFIAIVATLLYFDARIRVEGFDLAILAQGLDRGAPPS